LNVVCLWKPVGYRTHVKNWTHDSTCWCISIHTQWLRSIQIKIDPQCVCLNSSLLHYSNSIECTSHIDSPS
jgi:hypothetical protein